MNCEEAEILLHALIGVEAHEVVIEANNARDGADDLLLKDVVGNLLAVLRDMNEAAVQFAAKPAQKRLCHGDTQARQGVWVEQIANRVLILVAVLEAGGNSARAGAASRSGRRASASGG